ncbi:Uncharacterised protein [Bacillus paralicheniformis]|nr:hypothetical protein DJ88_2660 [Bacillus paralicheniformis]KUL11062.1 hypothetical protein LI7559_09930 [Bacillus licheniformis LMG 7559]KUL16828.1 hypothetical protein LI6934_14005 [Bacillus licheniformis LMG 6934]VEB20044.1 Uncharacterised protein [Bacillus paralicheniformis]
MAQQEDKEEEGRLPASPKRATIHLQYRMR